MAPGAAGLPPRRGYLRLVRRHRRLLAAVLAGAATVAGLRAVRPTPARTEFVAVAARDLPAGARLAPGDVQRRPWPVGSSPDGVLTQPSGRTLAAAVRRGEPITDARVTGPGLLTGQPAETVAVGIRVADPGIAAWVRTGDRVDVLASGLPEDAASGTGRDGAPAAGSIQNSGRKGLLAARALVLAAAGSSSGVDPAGTSAWGGAVPNSESGQPGSAGDVIMLAVSSADAARLAAVAGVRPLSVAITR